MSLVRLRSGKLLAVRIWRIVIYLDKVDFPSLRHGGVVVDYKNKRPSAMHLMGRFCFITDSSLSHAGMG